MGNKKKLGIGDIIAPATGVGMGIIGSLTQKKREKRAMENQMELNRQGQQLAVQTWNQTNAEAQRKHYENAGLSVGLMYGGNGAGGATATSGSGGSAPAPQQLDLQGAQNVALMKAQEEKIKAETDNIRGEKGTVGEAQIKKLLEEAKTEVQRGGLTLQQALKTAEEISLLDRKNHIDAQLVDEAIQGLKNQYIQTAIENKLKQSKTKLNNKEIEAYREKLNIEWAKAGGGIIKGIGGAIGGAAAGAAKTVPQLLKELAKARKAGRY